MHPLRFLTIAATLTAATSFTSSAYMLAQAGAAGIPAVSAADQKNEARVIVNEDFAGFTAGTEDAPDATNIANLRTGAIDPKYTSAPGWTGAAIYQAGGVCAITTGRYQGEDGPYEDTGFLRTPMGDYAGALTVSFRARLLDSSAEGDAMAVILNSTSGRLEARTVTVTPQWQSFRLDFSKGLFADCLIEISMLKEKVLIDDISITSVQTSLPAPTALPATDFKADGFTAHWTETADADHYLLTVYTRDAAKAIQTVDFENLNLTADGKHIDPSDPGLPEGWNFACGNGADSHISDKGANGSTGIVFAGNGDGFETPETTRPIRDFSFYAAHPSGVECFSKIRLACLTGTSWVTIGNIDIERIAREGEVIDLSSKLPEGTTKIQLSFNKNETNDAGKDVSIVIDNIRIITDPEAEAFITDRVTEGLSAEIDGLDPETDYSYTVKACNDKFSSAESNNMMARGLAAPELLRADNADGSSYTARWNPSPKAEGYLVTNYRVFTAPEDTEVTLLYENFDKVTQGSLSSPVGLYNTYNPKSLDEYTITPGWLGLCNYMVNGMMGTRTFFTAKGSIQTPALDLSANDGRFKVNITIVGDSDAVGDSLVVQAGAKVFQRRLIDKHSTPIAYTLEFDCGEAVMPLLLYSYKGMPFYIDEISVTQLYKKGQMSFTETETKTIEGRSNTSADFTGLKAGDNESFAYGVTAYRDFYGSRIFSVTDEVMPVSQSSGIGETVGDSAMTVSAGNGHITVSTPSADHVTVYGINGVKICDMAVQAGNTVIGIPAPGLYLVVAETGFTAKVIVR